MFVMPGMTKSHVHLSYSNAHPSNLDRQPIPIAMLDAVDNARTLLHFGFTSAISFGSAQGIDVPLRDAINAGRVPGPRLLASEKDVGSTGSNADSKEPGQRWSQADRRRSVGGTGRGARGCQQAPTS